MALVLKQIFATGSDEIAQNYTIESWHVSQSVDALTGQEAYDITISGSLNLTGSTLTGSTANITSITGSLLGTASWANNTLTASYVQTAQTASYVLNAVSSSFASTASYYPYGTNALTYGAFSDRTTQTILQDTSGSLTFNTTDLANGINIGVPTSRLVVTKTGIYNLQFSVQVALSASANGTAYLWLKKNGINQTYTNTGIYMQNANDKHVAAWNFVLSLNAGDYLELVMWGQSANVSALTEAPIPGAGGNGNVGVPSIIATLTQIT